MDGQHTRRYMGLWPTRISRIGLDCGSIWVMKDKEKNKSKIKLIDDESGEKEEKKRGRPTIFTPELRAKLIKLFEKHFFLAIVAVEAGIYRRRIYEWQSEDENFRNDVTHAQGKWIAQQMELLNEYAKDKRTKDWRAQKYLLSIADSEYNDKKYLREAPEKRDPTSITIIIDRRDLKTAEEETEKIIGETKTEEEPISLSLFEEGKKELKNKNNIR
ncbi:hypothetical protein ES705_31169 [subsurface metagenome]